MKLRFPRNKFLVRNDSHENHENDEKKHKFIPINHINI